MSDAVWQSLIVAVPVLTLGVMQERTKRAIAKAASEAAARGKETKEALVETNQITTEKLNTIHTLVNSSLGVPLKALVMALRRIANVSKNPEDIEAARLAELASAEHERKQAIVDSGKIC